MIHSDQTKQKIGNGKGTVENSDNFLAAKIDKPIYGITLSFIIGIIVGKYLTLPFLLLYVGLAFLFGLALILYLKKKEK